MKNIIKFLFGDKKWRAREAEKTINDSHHYICHSCGGTGNVFSDDGQKRVVCQNCAAIIYLGEYKLEVSGTNHKEVESVSLRLIEEISTKLRSNIESLQDKSLTELSESLKNGEIANSIENLVTFCKVNKLVEFETEAISLSSRLNSLTKSKREGIITYDEFVINQNKIINSIAEILNLINKKIQKRI